MSATQTATPAPVTIGSEWKTPAGLVGMFSLSLLLVGLSVACYLKDTTAIDLITGAIVANAGQVVNFYMGSSRSSQKKDETIAAQLPTAPPTVTVAMPAAPVIQGGTV